MRKGTNTQLLYIFYISSIPNNTDQLQLSRAVFTQKYSDTRQNVTRLFPNRPGFCVQAMIGEFFEIFSLHVKARRAHNLCLFIIELI